MKHKPLGIRKIHPIEARCKKTIYDSFNDAKATIDHLQETKGVKNLSAYKCTVCGFWHLTSK